jgi:hypothetical protein
MAGSPARRSTLVADSALAAGGGVLLHLGSGNYHGLNETGWAIWQLIDGDRSDAEIAAELRGQVEEPPDELADDVARFLAAMRVRELVE